MVSCYQGAETGEEGGKIFTASVDLAVGVDK